MNATLLDVLIDGFEKNEILEGYHWRDLPLSTEAEAIDRFRAFTQEARQWKGRPDAHQREGGCEAMFWPDLQILRAGRALRIRVRAPWFNEWWNDHDTWAGDPFEGMWEWQRAVGSGTAQEGAPDPDPSVKELLRSIHVNLADLTAMLEKVDGHWIGEDGVYRFYHQSFKVFYLQAATLDIVTALRAVAPERELNPWFTAIVAEGTGREFRPDDNADWLGRTRPIVEAFFHARWFLEMVIRYGRELQVAPASMPSGWAGVLYLYGLR